ncbi:MAG TPA: hypothetical protein PLF22_03890 [Pseudomonadales bacterium]|nr:hypothetical protein [Pseudomonadales bacterium]
MQRLWGEFPFLWTLGGVLAILLLRSWRDIVWPTATFEDRINLISLFFSTHDITLVTRNYNGYASVFPDFIAWLLAGLPASWIPYAFSCAAMLVCATTMSLFASQAYRWLLDDDRARQATCLLMAALPLGTNSLVSNLTYTQYNFLFMLFLLLLQNPAQSWQKNLLVTPFIIACIFSHPGSILCLLPCLFILAIAPVQRKFFTLFFMASAVIYNIFLVDKAVLDMLTPDYILFRFFIACAAFIGRGILEPLIGANAAVALLQQAMFLKVAAFSSMAMLLITLFFGLHCLIKKQLANAAVIVLFYGGFLIIFVSILTRLTGWGWQQHLYDVSNQRYIYATRLCTLVSIACLLYPFMQQQFLNRYSRSFLFLLLTGCLLYANTLAFTLYQTDTSNSEKLTAFMRNIQQEIDSGNVACLQHQDCTRVLADPDPRWPITLDLKNRRP